MKNIILEIQEQFFKKLEEKNGWGKNEVQTLYQEISIVVLAEYAQSISHLIRTPIQEPKQSLPNNNEPVSQRTDYSTTAPFSGFDDEEDASLDTMPRDYNPEVDDLPF